MTAAEQLTPGTSERPPARHDPTDPSGPPPAPTRAAGRFRLSGGDLMLCIRNGRYVLVCDGPTCPERTELTNARASGWMLTSPLGPHWCPTDVAARFHQLMHRTFSDPAA